LTVAWEVVSDEVRHVFLEAEPKRGALNSIDLGSARKFAVAEATLWSVFGGVSFAAQVATMVCSEAPATKFDKKINIIFNETKTMLCRSTALSVRKYLSTSAFSPRPRLVKKGSAAAVAEAAAEAAAEHAATELADLRKKASFYDAAPPGRCGCAGPC
jgi:hypothetical protein